MENILIPSFLRLIVSQYVEEVKKWPFCDLLGITKATPVPKT